MSRQQDVDPHPARVQPPAAPRTPHERQGPLRFLRGVVADFFDDRVLSLAAAVAFYTALSLAPLLVLLLWITSLLGEHAQLQLVQQIQRLVGSEAGAVVQGIVDNADEALGFKNVAAAISVATLLVSASAVFTELQSSLNLIWGVRAKPGVGWRGWLRRRLLSMGMVGTLAFLTLVSLAASTAIGLLTQTWSEKSIWGVLSVLLDLAVFTALFAAAFRLLPDARISWHDTWVGAAVTAFLFALGKWAIGLYLAERGLGSTYGAAGSMVVLLVWVYYSCTLLFLGAEFTHAWARWNGRAFVPTRYAVRIEDDA